jgi:hypothetical protein
MSKVAAQRGAEVDGVRPVAAAFRCGGRVEVHAAHRVAAVISPAAASLAAAPSWAAVLSGIGELEEPEVEITVRQRNAIGFITIARTLLGRYPRRSALSFSLFIGQAFCTTRSSSPTPSR